MTNQGLLIAPSDCLLDPAGSYRSDKGLFTATTVDRELEGLDGE